MQFFEDVEIGGDGRLAAVVCADGTRFACAAAVLTTGTFLRGMIHIGHRSEPAGRVGEAPSVGLALTLERLALPLGRLKLPTTPISTGSPANWNTTGVVAVAALAASVEGNPPVAITLTC